MSGPLKVMFLSSCVRGGGAGWSLYYLLKHLDRERIEPLVVVPTPGIFEERLSALGVRVVSAPLMPERTAQQRFERSGALASGASYALNLWDSARLVPFLARLARRERVELIYCNNMMLESLGALAAQLSGTPCVLHARNLHDTAPRKLLYCSTVARLPAVRCVVSNSDASAAPYRSTVPDKTVVVHNGVDLGDYAAAPAGGGLRERFGIAADDVLVCFTGNLIPRKGLDVLIEAAALCVGDRPRLRFVAVGRVPIGSRVDHRARYEAQVAARGLAGCFHFAGFVDDVRGVVADADVLVLPSRQEPFGRSIIEAMALGTPVVASGVDGILEIIEDGRDGLLVPAGDASALADAIGRLADDPGLRRRLAEAGLAAIRARFDVAKLTRELEVLMQRSAAATPHLAAS